MKHVVWVLLFLVSFNTATAELVELGLSGNYRRTFLTDQNSEFRSFDEMHALTLSVAYYLYEMTALEFSYTTGESNRNIPSATISSKTKHSYSMIGGDIVFTFGKRTDRFIPYLKAGVGYLAKKEIEYEYINHTTPGPPERRVSPQDTAFVPSAGFGMRTLLSKNFSIKCGIEMWTSGPIRKGLDDLDWAARLGLSWYLE